MLGSIQKFPKWQTPANRTNEALLSNKEELKALKHKSEIFYIKRAEDNPFYLNMSQILVIMHFTVTVTLQLQ